jgi:hypothetical protein
VGTIVSDGSTFGSSLVRSVLRGTFSLLSIHLSAPLPIRVRVTHTRPQGCSLCHGDWRRKSDQRLGRGCAGILWGQSVSPLIIADMARCLTTHTGIQSDIKGIARLRACAYLIAVLGNILQLVVFRHTARGVFHLSFHQTLLSNLRWSSLKSNHQRGLRRLWVRIHKYQIDIVQTLVSARCTLQPHKWRNMALRFLNSLPNLHKRLQNSLVGTRLAF